MYKVGIRIISFEYQYGKGGVEFRPISTLTSEGPIEFNVTAADEDYTDVGRTFLYLQATIRKDTAAQKNQAIADADKVAPSNLWLHTLFSQVDVKLNGTLITPSVNTYPYRAYLETLLSYGKEAKDGQLAMQGWYQDRAGKFDDTTVAEGDDGNPGFKERHKLISKQEGPVELLGRLHCDLFQQDRYLPNGVEMNVKLTRSSDLYNIIGQVIAGTTYRVHIETAVLYVRRVKVNPSISVEHNKRLDTGTNAKYPLRRAVVNTFTIPTGTLSKVQDNVIQGQLPRRVVLGMVKNSAYNGSLKQNPFEFEHFNMNYLALYVEGEPVPAQPYKPNFDANQYLRSYLSLYEASGMWNDDRGNCISRKDYPSGYMLHMFDLTADMSEGQHMDPIKHGSLRVEVHFSQALTETVNVILYCEYDNLLQIDRARNVITDY